MNRIYQGRVTKVEVQDGQGGWKPLDDDSKRAKEKWQAELSKVRGGMNESAHLSAGN